MTSIAPNFHNVTPQTSASRHLAAFPVGGADPDFVSFERSKPLVCAIPVLGKILPQCK